MQEDAMSYMGAGITLCINTRWHWLARKQFCGKKALGVLEDNQMNMS